MKFRMFIEDKDHALGGGRFGRWHLVKTGELAAEDVPAWNTARRVFVEKRAIVVYADAPVNVPVPRRDIAHDLKPGEYLYDPGDPSTWDEWTRAHHRQEGLVNDLCELWAGTTLTDEQMDQVIALVKARGITRADFRLLDERPDEWGYERDGKTWHWKLRQVRNHPAKGRELFAALAK